MKTWIPAILALSLAAAVPLFGQASRVFATNGRIPLGIESFRLQPAGREFYLMASVENPTFQGLYRYPDKHGRFHLYSANDQPMTYYPSKVQFRLTASAREKLMDDKPFDTRSKLDIADLLRQLRFRVKIFHGLEYRYIAPNQVQDIGLPGDVPYDERIYRIGFDLGRVPIDDRVVMEVLTPNGERLCKFHLDLL